jgi:D-inositol-3-phosphate glycosyltransferase
VEGVISQAESDNITYDVIHSHYWLSGCVALELREHWGNPTLHMFHTLGKMKNTVAQSEKEQEPLLRIEKEEKIVQMADRIIAATPTEQEQLETLYGANSDRIRVIPPGVDLELFKPIPVERAKEQVALDPSCRSILFVGRIEPLKGIDTLLWAISLITRKHPELTCGMCVPIIGGDSTQNHRDDEMARLKDIGERLEIGDVVTFLGSRDQDNLPNYYSSAEVVIMPSDYESFGMVALEAMACGTPVIASDVGGLAHLVKHGRTGYRVPARDPGALAEKITRLLTDEGLRRRMGQRAACWAEGYGWPIIADRIEVAYAELGVTPQ